MSTNINLKDGAAQYIEHLEAIGKKPSTVGTARRTMDLFVGHLGEAKGVGKILPVHVAGFFKSEMATMLKGKPRAQASILQIRRIVRGALVFWHEQGFTESVALPKEDRRFLPALSSSQSERVEGEPRQPRKAPPAPESDATQDAGETTATESDAAADSQEETKE